MNRFDGKLAAKCVLIGIVAGLRSMMAPAAVVGDLARRRPDLPMTRFFACAASVRARDITVLNSIGEGVFDKLPFAGARTQGPSVVFRSLSGALAAGALAASRRSPAALGAALGVLGALAGTYGGYHARKWLGEHTVVPDPLIGLAEDGIALSASRIAIS